MTPKNNFSKKLTILYKFSKRFSETSIVLRNFKSFAQKRSDQPKRVNNGIFHIALKVTLKIDFEIL